MAEARKRVLVVGGSGYLGQHLLQGFSRGAGSERYALAFTHHRPSPPAELVDAVSPVRPFRVDLRTGDGFDAISTAFGQVRRSSHRCSLGRHLRSLHVKISRRICLIAVERFDYLGSSIRFRAMQIVPPRGLQIRRPVVSFKSLEVNVVYLMLYIL